MNTVQNGGDGNFAHAVHDAAGNVIASPDVADDVNEHTKTDVSLSHLADIVLSSSDAILSKTLDGIIISWNPGAERMFGYTASEIIGQSITCLIPTQNTDEERDILKLIAAGIRIDHYETVRVTKDGRLLDVSLTISPVYDREGNIVAASKIIRDVTEHKKSERHVRILLAELNHRSRNLLSVVKGIIALSSTGTDTVTFAADFSARIDSLAACHSLFADKEWKGADVKTLLDSQLKPFLFDSGNRISCIGPPLIIRPTAAEAIGMAIHELATNALKYGALSTPHGRVTVNWHARSQSPEPVFMMTWREACGPKVTPPTRSGFGRMVTGEMIESALHGRVEMEYGEDGICWSLRSPLKQMVPPVADREAWNTTSIKASSCDRE